MIVSMFAIFGEFGRVSGFPHCRSDSQSGLSGLLLTSFFEVTLVFSPFFNESMGRYRDGKHKVWLYLAAVFPVLSLVCFGLGCWRTIQLNAG
jgi:hypothetical protein